MHQSTARALANAPRVVATPPETTILEPKAQEAPTDLVYRFKISRRAAPAEFRNLWELSVKGPADKDWRVEIDADMLSTVISRINYLFELDGL